MKTILPILVALLAMVACCLAAPSSDLSTVDTLITDLEDAKLQSVLAQEMDDEDDDDDDDVAALEALLQTADAQGFGSILKKALKKAAPIVKKGAELYLANGAGAQNDDYDDDSALEALLQTADQTAKAQLIGALLNSAALLAPLLAKLHPTTGKAQHDEDDDDSDSALEALLQTADQTAKAQLIGSLVKSLVPLVLTNKLYPTNGAGLKAQQNDDDDDDDIAALEALLQTADAQGWGSVGKFFKKAAKKAVPILKTGAKAYLNNPLASNLIDKIPNPKLRAALIQSAEEAEDIARLEALLNQARGQSWGSFTRGLSKGLKTVGKYGVPVAKTLLGK